jgi:hypothetical protein
VANWLTLRSGTARAFRNPLDRYLSCASVYFLLTKSVYLRICHWTENRALDALYVCMCDDDNALGSSSIVQGVADFAGKRNGISRVGDGEGVDE